MKILATLILTLLLAGNAFSSNIVPGKVYSMDEFKNKTKLGERPAVPCPCVWNKNRGRGEDFTVVDDGNVWECKVWNTEGKCDGVGTVKGQ